MERVEGAGDEMRAGVITRSRLPSAGTYHSHGSFDIIIVQANTARVIASEKDMRETGVWFTS
jgi:zona occludens toxin (predicted ATPase)